MYTAVETVSQRTESGEKSSKGGDVNEKAQKTVFGRSHYLDHF